MPDFAKQQLADQQQWRQGSPVLEDQERVSSRGDRFLNQGAAILRSERDGIEAYVKRHKLTAHRHFDHLLSSQAFCFNFFAPFQARPGALADLLMPIVGVAITPIWLPGENAFVAFEYISGPDYLNEGGKRTRGAQCTSVDAAVGFVREGRRELLLIEWKYTESYGAPLENKPRPAGKDGHATSNDVRRSRYSPWFEKVIDTDGGDRGIDLFFAEPFYQLMRQQMLAHAIESDTTDPRSSFDRVTLCHVSPEGNDKLKRVTVEGLAEAIGSESACGGWGKLLRQPDRYKPVSVEELFRSFPIDGHPDLAEWHAYMRERYAFLA